MNSVPGPHVRFAPAAQPITPVFIRLLGGFELIVLGKDRASFLTYDKAKLMLAALALSSGRPISRAKLASLIWPDVSQSDGRARVRHALHMLRQALEPVPDILLIETSQLTLRPDDVQVDVLTVLNEPPSSGKIDDIERLEWYNGRLLEGINYSQSETLLSWHQGWNARIEIELAQCRARISAHHMNHGDTDWALTHAKRWVELWPDDETCHRHLIRLLLTTGQRDAAVLAFEHCAKILAEQLGVAPSPETRSLLGLENQNITVATITASAERSFRPMAVIAVAITWRPESNAEDALTTLLACREQIIACIQEAGAWMPSSTDNNLLAYFGYPALSEQPIAQAVSLAHKLNSLRLDDRLQIGLGIHADISLAMPGDRPDAGALLSQHAIPLAWLANKGEILVSQAAASRLDHWQTTQVKRNEQIYHLLLDRGQSNVVPRMYGRTREFDHLVQNWVRLQPGRTPTTILVSGFAGVGKSLLVNALADYCRQTDGCVIHMECVENQDEIPLHPLRAWLSRCLGIAQSHLAIEPDEQTRARRLERLRTLFNLKSGESAATLLDLVRSTHATIASGNVMNASIDAAINGLTSSGVTPSQPILLIWENLHWADEPSLLLLSKLASIVCRNPIMIIMTARDNTVITANRCLHLEPLSGVSMGQFIMQLGKPYRLSKKLREQITTQSVGVPRYANLIIRQHAVGASLEHISSLRDSLCISLLRMPAHIRSAAYLAALYHDNFLPELLTDILGSATENAPGIVDDLLCAGILRHAPGQTLFCPRIVKNSIRTLMLRREKQLMHQRIANYLVETDHPSALIAEHMEKANDPSCPLWWRTASLDATQNGQARDGAHHIRQALRLSHYIVAEEERSNFEFECNLILGELESALKGPAAASAVAAYDQATELVPTGSQEAQLGTLWGQWVIHHSQGNYTKARNLAKELLHIATVQDHKESQGWALYAIAMCDLWIGKSAPAERLLSQSLGLLSSFNHNPARHTVYGPNSTALIYGSLGLALGMQGKIQAGLERARQGVLLSKDSNASVTQASCLLFSARIHYLDGNTTAAAKEAHKILRHVPYVDYFEPWNSMAIAYSLLSSLLEQPDNDTMSQLLRTIPAVEHGLPNQTASLKCLAARGLIALNRIQEAFAMLDEAQDWLDEHESVAVLPEIHCIRGDAWRTSGELEKAKGEWQQARSIALSHSLIPYIDWAEKRLMNSAWAQSR